MQRLRHRQSFRWLALFALVLEAVLTFGHVHLDTADARVNARLPLLLQSVATATEKNCKTGADVNACAAATAPSDHDERDGSDCPICIVRTLAAATVIPVQPAVFAPDAVPLETEPQEARLSLPQIVTAHFRARAPPIA